MFLIKALERVSLLSGYLGAVLTLPLIGALVFEAVSRYMLGKPVPWANEMAYMLMGSIFMLATAWALQTRQHVNVDFLYGVMRPRAKATVNLIGFSLFLASSVLLTYELTVSAYDAYQWGERSGKTAWNPLLWPFRSVLAIGFMVLTLQVVAEIAKASRALITGANIEDLK